MDAYPRLFAGVLVGIDAEEEGPVGAANRYHLELSFWRREPFLPFGLLRLPQGASGGQGFDPASVTPAEFQELVRAILPTGVRLGDACLVAKVEGEPLFVTRDTPETRSVYFGRYAQVMLDDIAFRLSRVDERSIAEGKRAMTALSEAVDRFKATEKGMERVSRLGEYQKALPAAAAVRHQRGTAAECVRQLLLLKDAVSPDQRSLFEGLRSYAQACVDELTPEDERLSHLTMEMLK